MSFGFAEIAIVVLLVLILFGAGKLPHVMGDLAKGVKNFKKGLADDDSAPETKADKAPDAGKPE